MGSLRLDPNEEITGQIAHNWDSNIPNVPINDDNSYNNRDHEALTTVWYGLRKQLSLGEFERKFHNSFEIQSVRKIGHFIKFSPLLQKMSKQ